ncbi:MAG TPA: ATP-binding protein [Pseudonocardiaceae bacterium]|nr:ATP-binding protein [Pseudonocardiaceae bacterium]
MGTAGAEQRQYEFAFGIPSIPPLTELRTWLRGLLADQAPELLIDIELVVTELVTNAYEHTGRLLAVRVSRPVDRPVLRVEVDDGAPELLPRPGASTRGGFRGRGLLMVEGISKKWGVDRGDEHKTVWVEIPLKR